MKRIDIHSDLEKATSKLLEMARESCWNKISENCEFILSEIIEEKASNLFEERKLRIVENSTKVPTSLNEVIEKLKLIYPNLYDINLLIFESKRDKTIIDVRYFLKSKLEPDYMQTVMANNPMLHCKIPIPPYHKNRDKKYDVNWELGGIRDKWKTLWWKVLSKLKY